MFQKLKVIFRVNYSKFKFIFFLFCCLVRQLERAKATGKFAAESSDLSMSNVKSDGSDSSDGEDGRNIRTKKMKTSSYA